MKDGGAIFPTSDHHNACVQPGEGCRVSNGMTLRDWFAGQALVGLLAQNLSATDKEMADEAFAIADAMVVSRQYEGRTP
jgi:hypothetical protein